MSKKDYTELIIQSGDMVSALKGLQVLLFYLPNADEVKPSDLDKINGIVSAITTFAEKNNYDLNKYFEY